MEALFQKFYGAYTRQDFGKAYEQLTSALDENPELAYRYFINRASLAMVHVLNGTGKSREFAARLDGLFAQHPTMNILCPDNDPAEVDRVRELRERNIERGLPSVVAVTQAKSASVAIGGIFFWGFQLQCIGYSVITLDVIESWARDFARGGACYNTHLIPLKRNIERLKRAGVNKIVVQVRDPRQRILSTIHHVIRYDDAYLNWSRNGFAKRTPDEQLEDVMPLYLESIDWLQGWIEAEKEIDILFSTYEQYVQDRKGFVQSYLDYYGVPVENFNPEFAYEMREGTDYHFRSGKTEEWREVFSPQWQERLSVLLPAKIRERFGWPE